MYSWRRCIGHTVQYSDFRATIPPAIYVSQTIYGQGPPSHRRNNHKFVFIRSETYFDNQRRYDGNRRAHHVDVEEVVDESELAADSSDDDLYDGDISDDSERSAGSADSDETVYAEAKEISQDRGPRRPELCSKTHKQEVKDQDNTVKAPLNYYKRLGIKRRATNEEIRKAARKMKIEVHLHRLTTAETSEEETKAINERAAEVSEAAAALLDHLTRLRHDEELQRREWANAS